MLVVNFYRCAGDLCYNQ